VGEAKTIVPEYFDSSVCIFFVSLLISSGACCTWEAIYIHTYRTSVMNEEGLWNIFGLAPLACGRLGQEQL